MWPRQHGVPASTSEIPFCPCVGDHSGDPRTTNRERRDRGRESKKHQDSSSALHQPAESSSPSWSSPWSTVCVVVVSHHLGDMAVILSPPGVGLVYRTQKRLDGQGTHIYKIYIYLHAFEWLRLLMSLGNGSHGIGEPRINRAPLEQTDRKGLHRIRSLLAGS